MTKSETQGGVTTSTVFGYDANNQLVSAGTTVYAYDPNGNAAKTGDVVGTDNQLLSDGTYNYTYDANGNEITKTNIATGDKWTYGYNSFNQMTTAVDKTSAGAVETSATYKYDVYGNRIEKDVTTGSVTTVQRYAYDGWNPAQPSAVGTENFGVWADLTGSNTVATRYLDGDGLDQELGRIDVNMTYWTLTDRQNSVRDVINNAGAVKDSIAYDAYGNITSETNSTYRGNYAWTGRQLDAETKLQYNRARYYDSTTGRWITQDPMGFDAGDSNLYRYVNNAPTRWTDPSGKEALQGLNVEQFLKLSPADQQVMLQKEKNSIAQLKTPETITSRQQTLDWYVEAAKSKGYTKVDAFFVSNHEVNAKLGKLGLELRQIQREWGGIKGTNEVAVDQKLKLINISFSMLGNNLDADSKGAQYLAGLRSVERYLEEESALRRQERFYKSLGKEPPSGPQVWTGATPDPAILQAQMAEAATRKEAENIKAELARFDPAKLNGSVQPAMGSYPNLEQDRKRFAELDRQRRSNPYGKSLTEWLLGFTPILGSMIHLAEAIEEKNAFGVVMSAAFLGFDLFGFAHVGLLGLRGAQGITRAGGRALELVGNPRQILGRLRSGLAGTTGEAAEQASTAGLRAAGVEVVEVEGGVLVGTTAALTSGRVGLPLVEVFGQRVAACFVAGTPLLTPEGEKAVEGFRVGDQILSRSESDPEAPVESRTVEKIFIRQSPILAIRVRGREIRTTGEHPFYALERGWICANELKPGDQLSSNDGQWVTVEAVTDLDEVATVYNLRVSDYHTYFVGSRAWGFSVWRITPALRFSSIRHRTRGGSAHVRVVSSPPSMTCVLQIPKRLEPGQDNQGTESTL